MLYLRSRRSIDLPPTEVAVLRTWQGEVEQREQALGKDLDGNALVF